MNGQNLAVPSGGHVPAEGSLNMTVGARDAQAMGIGLAGAQSVERPPGRDHSEIASTTAAFSASREGKRLNMLGFNSHLMDREGAAAATNSLAANV